MSSKQVDSNCLYVSLRLPHNEKIVDLLLFESGQRVQRILISSDNNPMAWIRLHTRGCIYYYSRFQLKSKSNDSESNTIPIFEDPIPDSIYDLVNHIDCKQKLNNHEIRHKLMQIFNPVTIGLIFKNI